MTWAHVQIGLLVVAAICCVVSLYSAMKAIHSADEVRRHLDAAEARNKQG